MVLFFCMIAISCFRRRGFFFSGCGFWDLLGEVDVHSDFSSFISSFASGRGLVWYMNVTANKCMCVPCGSNHTLVYNVTVRYLCSSSGLATARDQVQETLLAHLVHPLFSLAETDHTILLRSLHGSLSLDLRSPHSVEEFHNTSLRCLLQSLLLLHHGTCGYVLIFQTQDILDAALLEQSSLLSLDLCASLRLQLRVCQ
jgi:hypothetical protein